MAEVWEWSQAKLKANFNLKSRWIPAGDRRALTLIVSEADYRHFLKLALQEGITWDEKVRQLIEVAIASQEASGG